MKKGFVSGRHWPRVSNFRAKSSKRRSERYFLNLPIRRSVSGRSVSRDRGARSTWQVEEKKPWVCRSCPEAAWLRGGRELECVEGGAMVPPVCQVPKAKGELLRNRETVECSGAQRKASRRKLKI